MMASVSEMSDADLGAKVELLHARLFASQSARNSKWSNQELKLPDDEHWRMWAEMYELWREQERRKTKRTGQ